MYYVYRVALGMLQPEKIQVSEYDPKQGDHRSLYSAWTALRYQTQSAFDTATNEVRQAIAIQARLAIVLNEIEQGCRDYAMAENIPPVLRVPREEQIRPVHAIAKINMRSRPPLPRHDTLPSSSGPATDPDPKSEKPTMRPPSSADNRTKEMKASDVRQLVKALKSTV